MIDDDALLDQLLAEAGVDIEPVGTTLRPRPSDRVAPLPLSFAQEVLWLLDRSSPGMTAYNVPFARRIIGRLDVVALERALSAIVARHEVLRTRFPVADGEPYQLVDAPAPVALRVVDLRDLAPEDREREADEIVARASRTPFDLERDHLFRATLIRRDVDDSVLLIETHHIVWDGVSLAILHRELSAAYRAFTSGAPFAPPLPAVQYADYAVWQRELLSGDRLDRLLGYWREQLAERGEPLSLPADYPQSALPSSEATQYATTIERATIERLSALAQRYNATLYTVMLAAYAVVLHRYTGQPNVVIGSNVGGRMEVETEDAIGYFNNTLPIRVDLSGDPGFGEVVRCVRETLFAAYDHQDVPLEKLVAELQNDDAGLGRAPLFNAVLTAQNAAPAPLELDGCRVEPYGVEIGVTKFDLTLFTAETGAGLRIMLRARADLWSLRTIERFMGHLRSVLEHAARAPDTRVTALELLTAPEREQLERWNGSRLAGEPPSVVALIEASVARVPDRVAVRAGDDVVTYRDLDLRANQLAHHLRARGAVEGTVVAVLLERSIEAIVALLGILKAGAAYAPLAIDQPVARIALQLEACGAGIVVTTDQHAGRAGAGTVVALDRDAERLAREPSDAPRVALPPETFAYVLFTSGSTGVPKPVAVTHANIANYERAVVRVLTDTTPAGSGDARALDGWQFGLTSTFAADLGNTALYPALCGGGTLHVIGHDVATDPQRFAAYAVEYALDVVKMTPSHCRALLAAALPQSRDVLLPRRTLVLGGERLPWELVDEIDAVLESRPGNSCRLVNHYGPTEATVGAATFAVTTASAREARDAGAASVPIGMPLANVRLYVCDAHGNDMPVGVPGELYIAGNGVAAGYLDRPDLTAERFVILEGRGRAYRTGDRVRRLVTGALEFLGRMDTQVKIRGFRVELGEIEAILGSHPDIAHAVVVEHSAGEEGMLVAYVQPKAASDDLCERLRQFVGERVPEHMVPATIVLVDALPLTKNGKLDRGALPPPALSRAVVAHVAPRTQAETDLVAIWTETFKREAGEIGVTDDFFALGGQSLLAIRLLGKISRLYGVRVALRTLFDNPTVERLATALETEPARAHAAAAGNGTVPRDPQRIGRAPARGPRPSADGATPS